jgi:hypothetical protein
MSIAVVNWSSAAIAGRFAAGRPNGSEQSARKRFAAPRSPYAGWIPSYIGNPGTRLTSHRGALPSKAELYSAIRYVQQVPEPDIRPRA